MQGAASSGEQDAPSRAAGLHNEKLGEPGTLKTAQPVQVKGTGKLVEGAGKVGVPCDGPWQGALSRGPGSRRTNLEEDRGMVTEVLVVAGLR